MTTITATNARSSFFQLLKKTVKGHLITKISSKEGTVVMLPESEYESLLETAELLAIPGFKASIAQADKEIAAGEVYSFEDVFDE